MTKKSELKQQVSAAIQACLEKKAEELSILEMEKGSGAFTDYFVLCSGTNPPLWARQRPRPWWNMHALSLACEYSISRAEPANLQLLSRRVWVRRVPSRRWISARTCSTLPKNARTRAA